MKLINLLIRELNNCSLGGDFRVSHHAEICQFDCFSLEINFKRARITKLWKSQTGLKLKKNTIYKRNNDTQYFSNIFDKQSNKTPWKMC